MHARSGPNNLQVLLYSLLCLELDEDELRKF